MLRDGLWRKRMTGARHDRHGAWDTWKRRMDNRCDDWLLLGMTIIGRVGEEDNERRGSAAEAPAQSAGAKLEKTGGTLPRKDGPLAREVPRSPASPPEQPSSSLPRTLALNIERHYWLIKTTTLEYPEGISRRISSSLLQFRKECETW